MTRGEVDAVVRSAFGAPLGEAWITHWDAHWRGAWLYIPARPIPYLHLRDPLPATCRWIRECEDIARSRGAPESRADDSMRRLGCLIGGQRIHF